MTDAPSSKSQKTAMDEFMLAEYATIANAHFQQHAALRQNFRFYLGILALPLTAAAVVLKDKATPGISDLPELLAYVVAGAAVVGVCMFFAMVNTRFDIVLYTRTVNAARRYFTLRAAEAGDTYLSQCLVLPTDSRVPSYAEARRADWWSFLMMALVNTAYAWVAARNLLKQPCACLLLAVVVFALHPGAYYLTAASREKQPIAGKPG
jgi:hypothetical protein